MVCYSVGRESQQGMSKAFSTAHKQTVKVKALTRAETLFFLPAACLTAHALARLRRALPAKACR